MDWSPRIPTAYPVAYDELIKSHLRLTTDDDRDYVAELIAAATEFAESSTESCFINRTITAVCQSNDHLFLPRGPLQSITSVTDDKGTVITDYDVKKYGEAIRLVPNVSFTSPLTVVFVAGYGATGASTPASIRMAIRTHVATQFEWTTSIVTKDQPFVVPHSLEAFYRENSRRIPLG